MPQLIDYLKNIVHSDEFCTKHKKNPQDFTRDRILTFSNLIFFMMNMNNDSYQAELDRFFQTVNHSEVPEHAIYKGNLSKARKKLKHEAFVDLNDHLVNHFYSNFQHKKWYNFNVISFDGSTVRLPDKPEIKPHFGEWHSPNEDKPCVIARISQMFDVKNKITIDARISPMSAGEREMAAYHLLKLGPNDLALMDRGYPAYWLFRLSLSMETNFCARISHNTWNFTKKFYKSGLKEQIVKLSPSPESHRKCYELGLDKKKLKVRLIRVELDSGETEFLVTSLLDGAEYPLDLFADLYHCRWLVEEDYKTFNE